MSHKIRLLWVWFLALLGWRRLSVLLFEEGGWWVAQVLEQDLATQARTLEDLLYEVHRLLAAHILLVETETGRDPWEGPPAPATFRKQFADASITLVIRGKRALWNGKRIPRLHLRIGAAT